jgi:hypothetical protein
MINKTNSYAITHNDYENIYLVAKDGNAEPYEFFQEQIAASSFKKHHEPKQEKEEESLI